MPKFIFHTQVNQTVMPLSAGHGRNLFQILGQKLQRELEDENRRAKPYNAVSRYYNPRNQVNRFPRAKVRIVK